MGEAPVYEIRTVQDFAKVPKRRLRACLREFAIAVDLHRATENLLHAVQRDLQNGGTIPLTDDIPWRMEVFRWVDDKEKKMTIKFSASDHREGAPRE